MAHPEFARLGHDPLLQLAETYLDDEDRAIREDLPAGACGYRRARTDDVAPAWSDEGFVSPDFALFVAGFLTLGFGVIYRPASTPGEIIASAAIIIGAGLIGIALGEGDGEAQ